MRFFVLQEIKNTQSTAHRTFVTGEQKSLAMEAPFFGTQRGSRVTMKIET
jgi:hypothetical protein